MGRAAVRDWYNKHAFNAFHYIFFQLLIVAIQAQSRQRLAAISLCNILSSGGLPNAFMPCVKKSVDNSLALVPQTGHQLKEASRLMEMAKLEEGNDFVILDTQLLTLDSSFSSKLFFLEIISY